MGKKKRPLNRSEIMSRIKGKDTKPELTLRKKLWSLGYRYRKNDKTVYGSPDICFKGKKVAIFVDSEFWHGRKYMEKGILPKTNTEYWRKKLIKNIERDNKVNKTLSKNGWKVLRFWDSDVIKNTDECIRLIEEHLKKND